MTSKLGNRLRSQTSRSEERRQPLKLLACSAGKNERLLKVQRRKRRRLIAVVPPCKYDKLIGDPPRVWNVCTR